MNNERNKPELNDEDLSAVTGGGAVNPLPPAIPVPGVNVMTVLTDVPQYIPRGGDLIVTGMSGQLEDEPGHQPGDE